MHGSDDGASLRPVMQPVWLASEERIAASCKDLQKACDLAPYGSKRWRELGYSFWESGRLQSALRAAETADALHPGHPATLMLLGRCRSAMAAHGGARSAFEGAYLALFSQELSPRDMPLAEGFGLSVIDDELMTCAFGLAQALSSELAQEVEDQRLGLAVRLNVMHGTALALLDATDGDAMVQCACELARACARSWLGDGGTPPRSPAAAARRAFAAAERMSAKF